MIKDDKLTIGSKTVVTLVSQTAAVSPGVLGPGGDVDGPVWDVRGIKDPIVVCLPRVGIKLRGIRPGPVVEGDGGPGLYVAPGEQALAGAGNLRLANMHHLGLIRVFGSGIWSNTNRCKLRIFENYLYK